MTVTPAFEGCR